MYNFTGRVFLVLGIALKFQSSLAKNGTVGKVRSVKNSLKLFNGAYLAGKKSISISISNVSVELIFCIFDVGTYLLMLTRISIFTLA